MKLEVYAEYAFYAFYAFLPRANDEDSAAVWCNRRVVTE